MNNNIIQEFIFFSDNRIIFKDYNNKFKLFINDIPAVRYSD